MPETIHPDPNNGSEFGGAPGLIQPKPHDPANSASETRMLMMQTNPAGIPTAGVWAPDPDDPFVPDTQRLA